MTTSNVTVEDLLAGASVDYDLTIPDHILRPGLDPASGEHPQSMSVKIRPLTIGVFQTILKAARHDEALIPLLMVKEAVVQPELTMAQVKQMHVGLITYLVDTIRTVSGMTEKKKELNPKTSAAAVLSYRLAKAFGWTPEVIRGLTPAEAQLYLDLLVLDANNE